MKLIDPKGIAARLHELDTDLSRVETVYMSERIHVIFRAAWKSSRTDMAFEAWVAQLPEGLLDVVIRLLPFFTGGRGDGLEVASTLLVLLHLQDDLRAW
ncbi:hypothetical protein TPA0598_04_02940 [Streptomyces lydicamycinicus]|uniref:Uncharacterized protein n=1 Tax=Streptomyces lydicamycinicus TaxID=1546107 RepID=A0A0P4R6A3_9ACTN|nr:hypothetical protein [Streptomyces lydicamycinicus]GAO08658.1 hypothetical protein TPA0598_04_02940 [Streptomyces lydicamycinicus]